MNKNKTIFFAFINTCLIGIALVIALEIWLRLPRRDGRYYLYPPNKVVTHTIAKGLMPGIEGKTRHTTNSLGLRGDELPAKSSDKDYVVLFLGGSTTECRYLDDRDAWPHLTIKSLNARGTRYAFYSENAGRSSYDVRHYKVILETLLPQMKTDCIVILCGGNESRTTLRPDHNAPSVNADKAHIFWNVWYTPSPKAPWYKKLRVWQLLKKIKTLYKSGLYDREGDEIMQARKNRQLSTEIDLSEYPGITQMIDESLLEYRQNIEALIRIAKGKNVRLIFADQPTLQRQDLPKEKQDLLWSGRIQILSYKKKRFCLSGKDAAETLARFNHTLKDTCSVHGVEFIELSTPINKDMDNFYDDGHFNVKGSHAISAVVADYLYKTTK